MYTKNNDCFYAKFIINNSELKTIKSLLYMILTCQKNIKILPQKYHSISNKFVLYIEVEAIQIQIYLKFLKLKIEV